MKIRQAKKIMCHNWRTINKSSTTAKASQRMKKYERKQPLLPKLKRKTLFINFEPHRDMFKELRDCYDGPARILP